MFTIRTMGGIALFLFGTTFLWLTTSFASKGVPTGSALWNVTNVLSLAVVLGFTVATWGLFKRTDWWETAAIVSAAAGLIVLVPYWIAASASGEVSPAWNVFVHVVGDAGVLVLLLVPALEHWVSRHVMAGR